MPLFYLRRLSGSARSPSANRQLARYLVFIAGATNAGGFLAVRQYTSHMTGIISAMADNIALGSLGLALGGLAAVISFLLGAICTTVLIRWARRHSLDSQYALPLILESLLLLIFGMTGHAFVEGRLLGTVMLLCFTMGLQNAMITKLSDAVIRTTHLTGMVTDVGIEIGRLIISSPRSGEQVIPPDMGRFRLLVSLIALFFVGGIVGALGFKHIGFWFTVPLALVLLLIAMMPILDDLRVHKERT